VRASVRTELNDEDAERVERLIAVASLIVDRT
jgi:hypothetical protein